MARPGMLLAAAAALAGLALVALIALLGDRRAPSGAVGPDLPGAEDGRRLLAEQPREPRPVGGPAPPVAAERAPPAARVTLVGRLHDPQGRLVLQEAVELRLVGADGGQQMRVEGGFFEAEGLWPGTYELEVVAEGWTSRRIEVELDGSAGFVQRDLQVAPARWVRLEVRGPGGADPQAALGALFVDGSKRVPRLLVSSQPLPEPGELLSQAGPEPPGRLHPEVLVNEARALSPGAADRGPQAFAAQLEVTQPGRLWVALALGRLLLDARELPPGETSLLLTLDHGLLERRLAGIGLVVLDGESGAPLAEVRAWVGDQAAVEGRSDAEGRIEVHGVVPGRTMVYLVPGQERRTGQAAGALAEELLWVDLPVGAFLELGPVLLRPPVRLELEVELDGLPVEEIDLEVALLRRHAGTRRRDPFLARTRVPGRLELDLPARELVLSVRTPDGPWLARPRVVDLAREGPRRVRVALERGTPLELIASPAAAGWRYVLLEESGLEAAAGHLDAQGRALFLLPPGEYWLELEDGEGRERAARRWAVGATPERLRL